MSEPTPLNVPEELRPLVAHRPEVLDILRKMRIDLEAASGLNEREIELTRLAAAIGLGAPPATFGAHVVRALAVGATSDEIWGVTMAIAPLTGLPKLLAAIPSIAAALDS